MDIVDYRSPLAFYHRVNDNRICSHLLIHRAGAAAIAESKTDPATYMLLTKYVDAIKEIGSGEQSKTVFLPFEASNLVGALGSLTELLPKK